MKYAGLWNTQYCFCGYADDDYDRHGESTACTSRCLGRNSDICGGPAALSIYEIGNSIIVHCIVLRNYCHWQSLLQLQKGLWNILNYISEIPQPMYALSATFLAIISFALLYFTLQQTHTTTNDILNGRTGMQSQPTMLSWLISLTAILTK